VHEAGCLTDTLVIAGATTHTFAGDSSQWNMVSVPARTYTADSVRGSGSLVTWDESGAERDIYGYYIPSREIREVTGGKAYWRKTCDTLTVSIGRASIVDTSTTIVLNRSKYGWNQVANPYPYPVRWSNGSSLWKWSGNDYELSSDVLEPWQGYWVMAESSEVVTLEPKPYFIDTGRMAKKASVYFAGKNDWRLRLSLEGEPDRRLENVKQRL
jgi:hypothetical protein